VWYFKRTQCSQKATQFVSQGQLLPPRIRERLFLSKPDSPPLYLKMEIYCFRRAELFCGIQNGRVQKPSNLKCIIPSFKVFGIDIYWYISGTEIYKISGTLKCTLPKTYATAICLMTCTPDPSNVQIHKSQNTYPLFIACIQLIWLWPL